MAGYAYNGANYDIALVRYNIDGSLDNTFDTDGIVTTPIGSGDDRGRSVTIQADGKILVAGRSTNGTNYDFTLVRYNTDGSLDNTFNSNGIVTTAIGSSHEEGYSAVIQTDGKILVPGTTDNGTNYDVALVRYNTDGSLDSTFDSNGIVTTAIGNDNEGGFSAALQIDGKILVTGNFLNSVKNYYDIALLRYNTDGSLDSSFDTDGIVTSAIGNFTEEGYSVTVQTDSKILVAGTNNTNGANYDFALLRYNIDGSIDSTFDKDGKVTTDIGNKDDLGLSAVIQTDGKILVSGEGRIGTNQYFVVVRYISCVNNLSSLSSTNITCKGLCDGSVSVSVLGGTAPYNYKWSNGDTTSTINGLCIGIYTGTVTDRDGCEVESIVTFTEPPLLTATITSTNVICNSYCNSSIDLIPAGGTLPYTYNWSNGATTEDLTNLCTGIYFLTLKDVNGCYVNLSSSITEPTALNVSLSKFDTTCGNVNRSASVNVTGGTPGYSYAWSTGSTDQAISGLIAGIYTITVTDANNCVTIDSVKVDSGLIVEAGPNQEFCKNSTPPGFINTVAVIPPGGTWLSDNPLVIPYLTSAGYLDHLNIPLGSYLIKYTINGCYDSLLIKITGSSIDSSDFSYCVSDSIFYLSKGSPYNGFWSGGKGSILNNTSGLVDPKGLEGQVVSYIYDADNCPDTIFITYDKGLNIPLIKCGISTKLSAQFAWEPVTDAISYDVSFDGINWFAPSGGASGFVHDISDLPEETTVLLYVRATNNSSCSPGKADSLSCHTVKFLIPNIITPNNDGVNDNFVIIGLLSNSTLSIFNRWGQVVYFQKNYKNNWDGGVLEANVYYYTLTNELYEPFQGWVRIIR